jgi:hypothetical protein
MEGPYVATTREAKEKDRPLGREDMPRPGVRKMITLCLPVELWVAVKTRARLLGRPMSALATVALEEYLGRAGRPVD